MAYNEQLADRTRQYLSDQHGVKVEEKPMMGGLTFMVNGKMCVGIVHDDLMARISPDAYEEALEKTGCREMDFTGRPMKGFVFVGPEGTTRPKDLAQWIDLALAFNKVARSSKKKTAKKKSR